MLSVETAPGHPLGKGTDAGSRAKSPQRPTAASSAPAMAASAALFAPVAKHRVTPATPVREGAGLDVERCAALHNTLMLYGWVCGGKKLPEMVRKSWWSRHGSQPLQKILHPEIVRYLQKIFDVPGHNFFYHLRGLAPPIEMLRLGDVLQDDDHDPDKAEKYRFIVLYSTSSALVTHPAGLMSVFLDLFAAVECWQLTNMQLRSSHPTSIIDADIQPRLRPAQSSSPLAKARSGFECLY